MRIASVCVVGGSGFVGRSVVDQLCASELRVRVLTRSRPRAMPLALLPTAEVEVADPHRPEDLARAFAKMDAVVNLVGILHEGAGRTFRDCHVELPHKVALACREAGVRHLLHMSALGASADGPSAYQRSKAAGEAAVREAAGPMPVTIFRPSVIFGEGDAFLNLFATLVRLFPVIPLARAEARFQPIWVEDVARSFCDALGDPAAFGAALELGGPKAYSLGELVAFVAATLHRKRVIVGLPAALGRLQAAVLGHLPGKLMTTDNLDSMSVDNVCAGPFPAQCRFKPAALEAIVPQYLAASAGRGRYSKFRYYAGR